MLFFSSVQVVSIDYSEETTRVKTKSGEIFEADKVIVTVPLSLLKKNVIEFKPELPQDKQQAIESLGTGLIEKVSGVEGDIKWRFNSLVPGRCGCNLELMIFIIKDRYLEYLTWNCHQVNAPDD